MTRRDRRGAQHDQPDGNTASRPFERVDTIAARGVRFGHVSHEARASTRGIAGSRPRKRTTTRITTRYKKNANAWGEK